MLARKFATLQAELGLAEACLSHFRTFKPLGFGTANSSRGSALKLHVPQPRKLDIHMMQDCKKAPLQKAPLQQINAPDIFVPVPAHLLLSLSVTLRLTWHTALYMYRLPTNETDATTPNTPRHTNTVLWTG
eukprot:scaffold204237_cov22-Prasinocladus_malaysianus.AAC.1